MPMYVFACVCVCVKALCICLSVCYLFFADTFASSAAVNKVKQESKRKRMLASVGPCNTLEKSYGNSFEVKYHKC